MPLPAVAVASAKDDVDALIARTPLAGAIVGGRPAPTFATNGEALQYHPLHRHKVTRGFGAANRQPDGLRLPQAHLIPIADVHAAHLAVCLGETHHFSDRATAAKCHQAKATATKRLER